MQTIRYCCFCLFFFSLSGGFCSGQNRIEKELATRTIYLTRGIISHSPELIKWQDGDRIYLDEERVTKKNIGGYVSIDGDTEVFLPILFSDEYGIFTSISKNFWDKAIHQICNKCGHEWQGGLFVMRCPVCKSRNISNIPS